VTIRFFVIMSFV